MIDLLTVVHGADLTLLMEQANSIDVHFKEEDIGTIHVIINDPNIKDINTDLWGKKFQHKVRIYTWCELTPNPDVRGTRWRQIDDIPGWFTQQALKMLGTAQSTADWVMVLDAKNVFVNDYNKDFCFDKDNRARVSLTTVSPHFIAGHRESEDYFNIPRSNKTISPPSVCPQFLKPEIVKRMLIHVERQSFMSFIDFWLATSMSKITGIVIFTEFIFYSNYVFYLNEFDRLYTGEMGFDWDYLYDDVLDCFDERMNSVREKSKNVNYMVVSIHPRAVWPKLTQAQRDEWMQYLSDQGLTLYRPLPKYKDYVANWQ